MSSDDAPRTDLLAKLDEAAVKILDKALASEKLEDSIEGFKVASAWLEKRTRLQPVEKAATGEKFTKLREKLHGQPGRAPKRGANPVAAEDADAGAGGGDEA